MCISAHAYFSYIYIQIKLKIMKYILPFIFILVVANSFSQKMTIIREFTTVGDSNLKKISFVKDEKDDQYLQITTMNDEVIVFISISNYDPKAKTNKTYIAAKSVDNISGGVVNNAIMLEILVDKHSAVLAYDGKIYFLASID